ncbi:MAG TPA: hypothetical protein VKT72_14665 [Candidatus Baltobacteraceae bacterium]|nr:hypothetical protein [Candidatus Baltobacteraceae bacterium]
MNFSLRWLFYQDVEWERPFSTRISASMRRADTDQAPGTTWMEV